MPGFLPPVLLSLLLGATIPGWSATADEREQHAIAIAKLINAHLRLPADRQLADYQAAGHPVGDPVLAQILRHLYLDAFLVSSPAGEQAALESERGGLQRDLTRAADAGELGAVARQLFSEAIDATARLVNDVARVMHPDAALPLVPLSQERARILTQQLATLGRQAEEAFVLAAGRVKAAQAADDDAWMFPEGSKEHQAAIQGAIERRLGALRPLLLAMQVLRDAAWRGQDFGIDPAPVRACLARLFTSPRTEWGGKTWTDVLSAWDFEWGEFNPLLHAACGVLLGDALVAGAKGVNEQDVAGILQQVADFGTRGFKDPAIRNAAYRMKLEAWADLLRFHLVQGDRRALDRAWVAWQDFSARALGDEHLRLDHNLILATDVGRVHLLAARIAGARNDLVAANTVVGGLLAAIPANPLAPMAKQWRLRWLASPPVNDQWGCGTTALNPERALMVARACLDEADASADTEVARQHRLRAAVVLRNGVMGLHRSATDADYAAFAPQLYQLYASVLNQLGLRHQAVVAAQDGARALISRIAWYTQRKLANPWKKARTDGTVGWDETRMSPARVATDALLIANQLRLRDPKMQATYITSIGLLRALEPQGDGPSLRQQQILAMLAEDDLTGALREADLLLHDRPERYLWVVRLRNTAIPRMVSGLLQQRQQAQADDAVTRLTADNSAASTYIDTHLEKIDLTEVERGELLATRMAIVNAEVTLLMLARRHEEAIARLIAVTAADPPTGDTVIAPLFGTLAEATHAWHAAREDLLAADAAALLAAAQRYDGICQAFLRGVGTMHNTQVDGVVRSARQRLSLVLHRTGVLLAKLPQPATADGELAAIRQTISRDFVALFEPTIDDRTPIPTVLFLARTLWDLGETERAAAQFTRFITMTRNDPLFQTFRRDPTAFLARFTTTVTARSELRSAWQVLVDSCQDQPQAAPGSAIARIRDPAQALDALGRLRTLMSEKKAIIAPEQYRQIESALNEVGAVLTAEVNLTMALRRLATFHRDHGQPEQALPLLRELYEAEPTSLENQWALVQATIAAPGERTTARADLQQARAIAARVRDARAGTVDKLGYWDAYLVVLELSVLLDEARMVDDALAFLARNRSDLSRDLIAPPVWGDDRRIRRPADPGAVLLARRLLGLHHVRGVGGVPAFQIVEVATPSGALPVFADAGTSAFVARTMGTPDGGQVIAIVAADGSTPPPASVPAP